MLPPPPTPGDVTGSLSCPAISLGLMWTWPRLARPRSIRPKSNITPILGTRTPVSTPGTNTEASFPSRFRLFILCNLAVHEKVTVLVEAAFGTYDIRIYASELWAKYAAAVRSEQDHHRDFLNHTPRAPSSDIRWRGLELFI